MKKILMIVVLGLSFIMNVNAADKKHGLAIGSEKLAIITKQPGAICMLTNNKGSWKVVTPNFVKVKRSKKQLKITCNKEGYEQSVTSYKLRSSKKVDKGYLSEKIGGAIGGAIHSGISGAALETFFAGKEIVNSKFGTYGTSFEKIGRKNNQPTIFITLNKK